MFRSLFSLLLIFLATLLCYAQSKLVIDDRTGLINDGVEQIITEKLSGEGIEYTHMVDFQERCNYHFTELQLVGEDLFATVKDCDGSSLGSKNLGSRIVSSSDQEKGLLLSFAIMDIVSEPGKYVVQVEPGPVSPTSEPETVQRDSMLKNEHDSRYFFAPSAYNLKKGELYYNTVYFLIHDIQYGVDDHFSIGIGTTVIGLPIYLTPKISFPIGNKSAFAIGDLFLIGTWGTNAMGNLVYGSFSTGGRDGNISIGAGHLYTNDNEITSKTSSLVTNFSAMGRLSPYIFLLTENYVMSANFNRDAWYENYDPNGYYEPINETFTQRNTFWYGIAGIRIISKNRDFISWQIGLTYVVNFPGDFPAKYNSWNHDAMEEMNMIAFPTVSFTVKFGKRL